MDRVRESLMKEGLCRRTDYPDQEADHTENVWHTWTSVVTSLLGQSHVSGPSGSNDPGEQLVATANLKDIWGVCVALQARDVHPMLV